MKEQRQTIHDFLHSDGQFLQARSHIYNMILLYNVYIQSGSLVIVNKIAKASMENE